jgi:hypothetical protein
MTRLPAYFVRFNQNVVGPRDIYEYDRARWQSRELPIACSNSDQVVVGLYDQGTRSYFTAREAAWVRLAAPSFRMQALTWCRAVAALIANRSAICSLLDPSTINANTSRSLSLKSRPGFSGPVLTRIKASVASGANVGRPELAERMASARASIDVSLRI